MSRLVVIVGGQFGSEGKGAVAAKLADEAFRSERSLDAIRVAGPNAGHTTYANGHQFKFRQLPVAAVQHKYAALHIAAGSEIDIPVLQAEIELAESCGFPVQDRLTIDPMANVITAQDKLTETDLVGKIGSTGKGIGAARASKLMRRALVASNYGQLDRYIQQPRFMADEVHIEGTQGYGLGIDAGFYPMCTSSNCRAIDFCAMAGLNPTDFNIYSPIVVFRPYPIRVAGNSGRLRDETSWEALGVEPERTTVTNKIRRVGGWDSALALDAMRANGRSARAALTMMDYPGVQPLSWYEDVIGPVVMVGNGPLVEDYTLL